MKEEWFVFYWSTQELSACTLHGSFPGEVQAVVELLASENNISPEEIRVAIETR